MIIPYYVCPTGPRIQPIINAKHVNPSLSIRVILNPNSGVGKSIDLVFATAIRSLQEAGVVVAGYVNTNYNTRPLQEVVSEITTWKKWYQPDGIFLDAMGNSLEYYKDLTTFIKTIGLGFSIGNPGTDVPVSHAEVVDTIVVANRPSEPDLSEYSKWQEAKIPSTKVGMILYGASSFPANFVKEAKRFAGWLYVTEQGIGTDPWQSISSYFNRLIYTLKPPKVGSLVPFYIFPTNEAIQPLINAKKQFPDVPIRVILNPNSGPGTNKDLIYLSAVVKLKQIGISVLGYVSTDYSARNGTTVKQEIHRWINWYQPDGIFLDEMGLNHKYYCSMSKYAKTYGIKYVVGNPGANIDVSASDDVDNIVVFEDGHLPSLSQFENWYGIENHQTKITMLNYKIPELPRQYIDEASQHFGWVYMTQDGVDDNPWDNFSTYFLALVQQLNRINVTES